MGKWRKIRGCMMKNKGDYGGKEGNLGVDNKCLG